MNRNQTPDGCIYDIPYFEEQIEFNITQINRKASDIKGIIIHGTGNTAKTATDYMHYKYFNSGNKNSSADYFVDHDSITRINNWKQGYTWHIGDRPNGLKVPYYGCYNKNTIGIEICANNYNDAKKMQATIENAIKLTIYLMKEINLDSSKVYRHWDITRKFCMGIGYPMVDLTKPEVHSNWVSFKKKIKEPVKFTNTTNSCKIDNQERLSWNEIIDLYSDFPERLKKAIIAIKKIAEEGSDLGDLEDLKFIDVLIYKIGNNLLVKK